MKYLIFSDESGSWSNIEEEYYIRAWVGITEEEYKRLKVSINSIHKSKKLKELKWRNFKNNFQHDMQYRKIFDSDFKIFVTISKPKFFWSKSYNVITVLENLKEGELTGDEEVQLSLKKKITNSARMVLFLNYYERQHIINSKSALLKTDTTEYEYIVDNPQFLNREWKEVANEVGIENVEIIKESKACPGIELADVICGCIKDFINEDPEASEIYGTCIKSKMIDIWNKSIPNPNLIFIEDFTDEERQKLDIFR